jgi:hypothetical protein
VFTGRSTYSRGRLLDPSCVTTYDVDVPSPRDVLVTKCELGGRYTNGVAVLRLRENTWSVPEQLVPTTRFRTHWDPLAVVHHVTEVVLDAQVEPDGNQRVTVDSGVL